MKVSKKEKVEEANIEEFQEENKETKEKGKNKKKVIIITSIVVLMVLLIGIVSILCYPRITLKGSENLKINLNEEYKEMGFTATKAFKDISSNVQVDGNVDTTKPGRYIITYFIKEGIFNNKVTRTIEVVDNVKPEIKLNGNSDVSICPNSKYEEIGFSAVDNYDGDITEKVMVLEEENTVTYEVEDSSNNKTVVTRNIKREDKEKPKLSLNGSSTKYVLKNNMYTEEGVSITDNCDKDLKDKLIIKGSVDTKKSGTYTLTYEVEDSSGNKSSLTRKVIVYERSNIISSNGIKKTIYLTFDDGPSATITPGVLKVLKEKGVKATFFVINKSSNLDYLIKQEHNEGHTVALHSYTHNYKTIYSSSQAYFDDLNKISNKVKSLIGIESKIIRFPGGASNTVSRNYSKGIMTYLTNEVVARGYHYFDWNVGSGDAGGSNTKEQVYRSVVNNLNPNRANVVLMHDFENNYKTLNALSDIIDYGLANGYTFLPIDMSTPLVVHGVNN